MNTHQIKLTGKRWSAKQVVCVAWVGLALLVLLPATVLLNGSFPFLSIIWLVVPLVVVVRSKDAHRIGFRGIHWRVFFSTAAINLSALLLIAVLAEPWSHAYQALVKAALASPSPDTTFAWLVRFNGVPAWAGLLLYTGLVTIFGEELFFRGWLLQTLQRCMKPVWAIVLQAALFTLPQLLAAFFLAPVQGAVYAVAYSFLAIGVVGGWAAWRTQSIWPSLASAAIWNLVIVAVVLNPVN
jgi:membrane protease YdiL (CAAX protease family)